MDFTRITRKYAQITVHAVDASGFAAPVSGVDVAVLPLRTSPDQSTQWTPAAFSSGVAVVLLAGPDADQTSAVSVPAEGGDLWARIVDDPEVDAAYIDRLSVLR